MNTIESNLQKSGNWPTKHMQRAGCRIWPRVENATLEQLDDSESLNEFIVLDSANPPKEGIKLQALDCH